MPHPDILKVLGMTTKEWGLLPFHDDTRQRLKEKAIAILSGDDVPVNASGKAIAIHKATLEAEAAGTVSRAGFETAMIQQAKMFGEAVEELRQRWEDLNKDLQTFKKEIMEQLRIMEDSRADFTFIAMERIKALEAKTKDIVAAE